MRRAKWIAGIVLVLWMILMQAVVGVAMILLIDHGAIDVFGTYLRLPFAAWCLLLVTAVGLASLLSVDRIATPFVPNRKL